MTCVRIALACCVLWLVQPRAWAAAADTKERAARKACLLGDVKTGTEILADLYLDTKDPTHIYNQGRCYEQNGENQQAALRFREYLRKAPRLPAAEVEEVERKIKELQGKDAGRAAGTAILPPAAPPAATTLPQPTAAPDPVANRPDPLGVAQPAPAPAPTEASPLYKRWWFWGAIGAVAAGGVVAAVLFSSKSPAQSPSCATTGVVCVP